MAVSKNVAAEVPAPAGDWLFRQAELVLGPLPGAQLVQKLYSGEIDGKTSIARMGTEFRPLAQVDAFRVHLARAEAKWRVDAAARVDRAQKARSRRTKIAMVVVICVIAGAGAAAGAVYLAVHPPWQSADDFADADISVEPPKIALAKARSRDDDLVEYPSDPDGKNKRVGDRVADRTRVAANDRPKTGQKTGKVGQESEADGLSTEQFDRGGINSVVASKQRSLYPCLIAEKKKKPELAATIPIEFVIGNDGHVAKVWVDNSDFKTGTLPECLLRELQRWPFKPYSGEQATVSLSFKIGKGG